MRYNSHTTISISRAGSTTSILVRARNSKINCETNAMTIQYLCFLGYEHTSLPSEATGDSNFRSFRYSAAGGGEPGERSAFAFVTWFVIRLR